MKFKVDENLPEEVTVLLSSAGHDAVSAQGQGLGAANDPTISARCQEEGRALVTLDLDFADIRQYPPQEYPGIIVLRLHRHDKASVARAIQHSLSLLRNEEIDRRLWIVDDVDVRIHGADA